ncbi:MAG: hypothetical protein ACI9DC_000326 [Gammaproteobacteria bacterium]|jgi:hypothetical protein
MLANGLFRGITKGLPRSLVPLRAEKIFVPSDCGEWRILKMQGQLFFTRDERRFNCEATLNVFEQQAQQDGRRCERQDERQGDCIHHPLDNLSGQHAEKPDND